MYSCFQGLVGRNMQHTCTIILLTSMSKLLYIMLKLQWNFEYRASFIHLYWQCTLDAHEKLWCPKDTLCLKKPKNSHKLHHFQDFWEPRLHHRLKCDFSIHEIFINENVWYYDVPLNASSLLKQSRAVRHSKPTSGSSHYTIFLTYAVSRFSHSS